jgi:hypothetical protein
MMKKTLLGFFFYYSLSCGILCASGTKDATGGDKLSCYMYEDTKQLVMLVEDAASMIEKNGEAAFEDFGEKDSKWLNDKFYLFVYDFSGTCLFHPIEPDLVGQNLTQFKDINGRPVVEMITEIGSIPRSDASGWVFYLWEPPWRSFPRWKSSYVRKAIAPDGKVYLVGSGLYNMKIEKMFIQTSVDRAADEILARGQEVVFKELKEQSCPLHILGCYITVLDEKGDMVVDASFPGLGKKRNFMSFRDYTGRNIAEAIMNGLKDKDRLWLLYIWPKENANRVSRYLLYVRKIKVGTEVFYVTSDFAVATPVWMK